MTKMDTNTPVSNSSATAAETSPKPVAAHLIAHTHWDREWFLTHEYTTAWIPELIDRVAELSETNKNYEFLFDGQTLVIEDLLKSDPTYRDKVETLISNQNLRIGPLYSQPDWRMLSGQLLLKNLTYGIGDAKDLGGDADVAWMVDTFGHISQAPQMLSMVGIDSVFVWRGVPELHPVFSWRAPDGTDVTTINLFGGYRNLYGITKTPEIALDRLVAEVDKLQPHYGPVPIPLFDGYDLDLEPEDPALYYQDFEVPDSVNIIASTPRIYSNAIRSSSADQPTIEGELISGRLGATFPGTLSSRTYLKVLHHDAERAIQLRAEPLAVLAHSRGASYNAERFEQAGREMLQNGVHDCICGVSIDQVHERMERSYRGIIEAASEEIDSAVGVVLDGFESGTYAISTAAMPGQTTQRANGQAVVAKTEGIGIRPVEQQYPVERIEEPVDTFAWENDYYQASVDATGISIDDRPVAQVLVRADNGDTYSSEPGEVIGTCSAVGSPILESRSKIDAVVQVDMRMEADGIDVDCQMNIRFDNTPVVSFALELDSNGVEYRVDLVFESGVETDSALAAMPFDLVRRNHADTHLLPAQLGPDLSTVLGGQREIDQVDEFPFQDFVALQSPSRSCMVMGSGIRSYQTSSTGTISVALRRSTEWVALTGLEHRFGDAGPAMYVPGARSERSIRHEIGFAVLPAATSTTDLWNVSEQFNNPPLLVETNGSGDLTQWDAFAANLPMTGLELVNDVYVARCFNPSVEPIALEEGSQTVTVAGGQVEPVEQALPGQILNLLAAIVAPSDGPVSQRSGESDLKVVCGMPSFRVGASRSKPDPVVLDRLNQRRQELNEQLVEVRRVQAESSGDPYYLAVHKEYVLAREEAELGLSVELNNRLAVSTETVSIPDEPVEEIAALGLYLNDLRSKRRIYDYVVQAM